jgi:membrane-bound lytic murein transglycosylase B
VISWRPLLARAAAAAAVAVLITAVGAAGSVAEPTATGASAAGTAAVPSTSAADVAAARKQASRAAAEVAVLTARLREADRAFAAGVASIGRSVADSVLAGAAADDADRRAGTAAATQARAARALYMGGGQAGLLSSLLRAQDAQDLALRAQAVRQALTHLESSARSARQGANGSATAARRASATADASIVVADDLARRADVVDALLRRAQASLDQLSQNAHRLAEARRAAQALAQARAEAAASRRAAARDVQATSVPPAYLALYRSAASTCPGLRWTLLAAVGQVESGHGRNVGPSSAGAVGPMQFMPATFRGYAVDGDADGRTDPMAPADAVFTASRYLCASGAGTTSGVQRALLRYNHAQWYVDLVLRVEQQLLASSP